MQWMELVFLPLPLAGHLRSTLEMAMHLLRHDPRLSATVLLMTTPIPGLTSTMDSSIKSVASSGLDIRFQELPPIDPLIVDKDEGLPAFLSLLVNLHKPHVKASITLFSSEHRQVIALIVDLFATAMIEVANELNIPTYVYFTSMASMLALMLHAPTLDQKKMLQDIDQIGIMVEVPGMSPTPLISMPTSLMDSTKQSYNWFLYHGQRFLEAKGIILNTFVELEPSPMKSLAEGRCVPDHPTPPVYSVGPVLGLSSSEDLPTRHQCIKWLDEQPISSVVVLCFGSMGNFTASQIEEMAIGLERSGSRFLWSLRSRSENGSFPVDAKLDEVLPKGFVKRTEGRGMVWGSRVPQVEILGHEAVGCFVTHCGWNSVLESLWFGVPMVAWPLYAEQHFNAVRLARDMGVAVELDMDRHGGNFVAASEVERALRCLMGESSVVGKNVRETAQMMKCASRKAVEERGSSFVSVGGLIHELTRGWSN